MEHVSTCARVSGRGGRDTVRVCGLVSSLLVPQADVLWFEHFLIGGFVAKDEVKSMHSLHHSPAGKYRQTAPKQCV